MPGSDPPHCPPSLASGVRPALGRPHDSRAAQSPPPPPSHCPVLNAVLGAFRCRDPLGSCLGTGPAMRTRRAAAKERALGNDGPSFTRDPTRRPPPPPRIAHNIFRRPARRCVGPGQCTAASLGGGASALMSATHVCHQRSPVTRRPVVGSQGQGYTALGPSQFHGIDVCLCA